MHQSCLLHQMSSAPLQDTNTPAGYQHGSSAWLELIYHKPSGHFGIHRPCTGTDHSCGSWVDTLLSRLMPVLCLLFPFHCAACPIHTTQCPSGNFPLIEMQVCLCLGITFSYCFSDFQSFSCSWTKTNPEGLVSIWIEIWKLVCVFCPLSQLQKREYSQ